MDNVCHYARLGLLSILINSPPFCPFLGHSSRTPISLRSSSLSSLHFFQGYPSIFSAKASTEISSYNTLSSAQVKRNNLIYLTTSAPQNIRPSLRFVPILQMTSTFLRSYVFLTPFFQGFKNYITYITFFIYI